MLLLANLASALPTWQYGGIGPTLDAGTTLLPLHPDEVGRKIALEPSAREAVMRSWTDGKCPSPSNRSSGWERNTSVSAPEGEYTRCVPTTSYTPAPILIRA